MTTAQAASTDDRLPTPGVWFSRGWGGCLVAVYVLLVLLPAVLGVLGASWVSPAVKAGRLAGLVGFAVLALQVALTARLPFTDRPFGLDRLSRFHRWTGIAACVLLAAHPALLAAGQTDAWRFSFFPSWQVNLGLAALALVVLGVLLAAFFAELGLDYNTWRVLHKGMTGVVVVGFVHGVFIGTDLRSGALRVYWWGLLVVSVGLFLYRNAWVPFWGRRRFRVRSVTCETHDTFTVCLEPTDGRPVSHLPGQFMFLTLVRPGRSTEEHPFTLSSAPTGDNTITATIKQSGDFTNTIDRTKPGDRALVELPFGRFSFALHETKRYLFIAGGVGITPIMSMLRAMRDLHDTRPVVLLYGNRTERDVIFRDELARMPHTVKVVHVLSSAAADWTGPTGYVTAEVIREHAGEVLAGAEVFVCGPPVMMRSVTRTLRSLGVPRRRIHTERFAL